MSAQRACLEAPKYPPRKAGALPTSAASGGQSRWPPLRRRGTARTLSWMGLGERRGSSVAERERDKEVRRRRRETERFVCGGEKESTASVANGGGGRCFL